MTIARHDQAHSAVDDRFAGVRETTAARRFEVEHDALRLTKAERMKALYGADNPASASDVVDEH